MKILTHCYDYRYTLLEYNNACKQISELSRGGPRGAKKNKKRLEAALKYAQVHYNKIKLRQIWA